MSRRALFLALPASLTLSACSYVVEHLPGVYRLAIQQGNIIEQSMVDQLRPGMNKRQVLYVMGSPMLSDYFHKNTWKYIFYDKSEDGEEQEKRLVLFFDNDEIVGVQGDFKPSENPVNRPVQQSTLELPKRELDKTLWNYISGLF